MIYKFKGISPHTNEIIYGNYTMPPNIREPIEGSAWIGNGGKHNIEWIEVDKNSIREYTGVFDVDGVPIYEGDSICVLSSEAATESKVVWENNKFIICNPSFQLGLSNLYKYVLI